MKSHRSSGLLFAVVLQSGPLSGLSAKGTIISPKKHHTVQFKNDALISGQKLSKEAGQGL